MKEGEKAILAIGIAFVFGFVLILFLILNK